MTKVEHNVHIINFCFKYKNSKMAAISLQIIMVLLYVQYIYCRSFLPTMFELLLLLLNLRVGNYQQQSSIRNRIMKIYIAYGFTHIKILNNNCI